jgi:hypothetical protein
MLVEADPPLALIVNPVELVDTLNPEPIPLKLIVCGELATLSVIVSVPVRGPTAVGVKVTEIVQFAPAATVVPQVLVWAKSPDVEMDASAREACPEFVRVTTCTELVEPIAWAAKFRLVGESVAAAATGTIPIPLRATSCGDPLVLSMTVTFPVREPAAVGVKATAIVQLAPAATVVPQVFV